MKTAFNNANSSYVNNKESYKATWTVGQNVYYALTARNISMEGWHLLLALLAALVRSTNVKVFLRSESEIIVCICKVLKQHG